MKKLEANSRAEELANLYGTSLVGLFKTRLSDGVILMANTAAARMVGCEDPVQLIQDGISVNDFYLPGQREVMLAHLQANGCLENYEITFKLATGKLVEVAVSARPFPEQDYLEETLVNITTRKQTEQDRSRLAAIVENSTDLVSTSTIDEKITYLNAAGWRMLGFAPDVDITTLLIEQFHPDWAYALIRETGIPVALKDGTWEGETAILTQQGVEVPVSQLIIAHKNAAGQVEYLSTITRDISDREKAEQDRQAYIVFLENLEVIDQIIRQSVDLNQMLQNVIEAAFAMYGCDRMWLLYPCDPDTATFRVPIERCHPDYPGAMVAGTELPSTPAWEGYCRDALQLKSPVQYGADNEHPLDPFLTEHYSVKAMMLTPVFPKIGKPWVLGLHQCSTGRSWDRYEQRLFQEIGNRLADSLSSLISLRNLQDSEKRYKSLVANIPGTVYRCRADSDWTMEYLSESVSQLTGYPAEDFIASAVRTFASVIHEDDREYVEREIAVALTQDSSFILEYRIVNADGQIRWVAERGQGAAPEGEPTRVLDGVIFDISDQKLAGLELTRLNAELTAANRILNATNEELIQTNSELEESQHRLRESESQLLQSEKLAAIGELASGVAHELNQPLNHISITVQLLERLIHKEQAVPEDILDEIAVIRDSIQRAVTIIRSMRDFSRRETSEATPVDVRQAVANALMMFGAQLKTHNIELVLEQPAEPVIVLGSENYLGQVLVNLITNARDALDDCSDQRDKTIRIKISETADRAVITVADNGHGIPDHHLGSIFNPFFTTKDPGSGTGLGLSIIHRIVEGLNGTITVQSTVEAGTEFTVSLPRQVVTGSGEYGAEGEDD